MGVDLAAARQHGVFGPPANGAQFFAQGLGRDLFKRGQRHQLEKRRQAVS
jgi:hypothetical protein